jgi:hypothetical protein
MKIKTNELIGAALDWAVAICEHNVGWGPEGEDRDYYSTDWAQGGPIIECEKVAIDWSEDNDWCASCEANPTRIFSATTPLIAAMRCYVASKLGDEIDVPEELCPPTA